MDSDRAEATSAVIEEALAPFAQPIHGLHPHPKNPRKGNIELLKTSLEKHGQRKPIVAMRDGTIVAGTHTWLAAVDLGWDKIAVVPFTGTDEEALAFLLMDNRSSDSSEYDDEALLAVLEEMMNAGHLVGTGYTADDYDDLLAQMDRIAEITAPDFEGGYATTDEEMAQRYKPDQHVPMQMMSISLPATEAGDFVHRVRALVKTWGVAAPRDAIVEAVRRAYDLENGNIVLDDEDDVAETE